MWFHGAFSKIRSLVASSRIQIQRSWLVLHRGYAQHLDHTAVRVVPSAEAFRWDDLYELDYYASRVTVVHVLLTHFRMPSVAKHLIAEFAISGAEMSLQSVAAKLTQGTSWRRIYKGPEPGHPLALRLPLLLVSWSPTSDKTIAREIELRNNVSIVSDFPNCPCDIYIVGRLLVDIQHTERDLRVAVTTSGGHFTVREWAKTAAQLLDQFVRQDDLQLTVNNAHRSECIHTCDPGNFFNFTLEELRRVILQSSEVLLVVGVAHSNPWRTHPAPFAVWQLPSMGVPAYKEVLHFVSQKPAAPVL